MKFFEVIKLILAGLTMSSLVISVLIIIEGVYRYVKDKIAKPAKDNGHALDALRYSLHKLRDPDAIPKMSEEDTKRLSDMREAVRNYEKKHRIPEWNYKFSPDAIGQGELLLKILDNVREINEKLDKKNEGSE